MSEQKVELAGKTGEELEKKSRGNDELVQQLKKLSQQLEGQRKLLRRESQERIDTRKKLLEAYGALEERVEARTENLQQDKTALKALVSEHTRDLRQANTALMESEQRYKLAQSSANICSWEINLETKEMEWSNHIDAMLHLPVNTFNRTWKSFKTFVAKDDRDRVHDFITNKSGSSGKSDIEFRIFSEAPHTCWFSGHAQVFKKKESDEKFLVGLFQDITTRKTAELQLASNQQHLETMIDERTKELSVARDHAEGSKKRLQLILDSAGEGIYGLNLEGRGTFVNKAATDMLGYGIHELIGHVQHDLIHHSHPNGEFYPREDSPIYAALKDSNVRHINNEVFWRKDGGSFPVEYTSTPIIDNGDILGAVVTFKDITTQKQSARLLIEAKDQAETANRAKSQFLASMSHELRTPLNAIIGFTELMQRDSSLDDEQQDNLNIVNQSGDHLLALINDILDIAKVEAGKMELNESNIELASFLRAIITMLSIRALSKDLSLLLEEDTTLPEFICTDELKLRQILINLISNAIKFTNQGQITVKVGYRESEELQFEVHDTGSGMTEAEQTSLFQAFTQTESGRKVEGTGLGLAISQRFVELLGGKIEVESHPGQGSVFRFSIDVTLVSEGDEIQQIRHVEGLASGQPRYKLLVVEDTEFSRLLLVNLLEKIGFEVQSVVNGQQAVDLFSSWQPDLIWMDIQMPVMDGKEATKQIRQLPGGDTLPIIAITASSTLEDKGKLLAFGFDDVVYKPFHEAQIIECLEAQLAAVFIDKQTLATKTPAQIMATLDEGQLQAIPDETREAISKAATEGDIEQLQHIIVALPDDLAELKTTLMSLAEGFEFETLLKQFNNSR